MGASDSLQPTSDSGQKVTLARLEDQIRWYDRKSSFNQKSYRRLKVCTMAAAALIPVLANINIKDSYWPQVTAGLGVLIVILEGLQQIYQFHSNWISYRSTCEALRHEKFLYLAKAGPYAKADSADILLAEQIESLVSQEHAKWTSSQAQNQQQSQGDESKK
jgi:hypothetical protein